MAAFRPKPGRAKLDAGSRYAIGLQACWPMLRLDGGRLESLTGQYHATGATAATLTGSPYGPAISSDGTVNSVFNAGKIYTSQANTVFLLFRYPGSLSGNECFCGSRVSDTDEHNIFILSSPTYVYGGNWNSDIRTSSGVFDANGIHSVCLTSDGSTTSLYYDGALADTGATQHASWASAEFKLNFNRASTNPFGGDLIFGAFWDYGLSAQMVIELTADPFLFIRPRSSISLYHAAAAPAPSTSKPFYFRQYVLSRRCG